MNNASLYYYYSLARAQSNSRYGGSKTMKSLTCVSCVEQDGAGREAEAGHVCTQLKPLELRVETQQQCKLRGSREPQTKGMKNCLQPSAQSTHPLQQQHNTTNARQTTRHSLCGFR